MFEQLDTRCSICGKETPWVERLGKGNYVRWCAEHIPKKLVEDMLTTMGPHERVKLRQALGRRGNPHV
jgi:hypothetical protein